MSIKVVVALLVAVLWSYAIMDVVVDTKRLVREVHSEVLYTRMLRDGYEERLHELYVATQEGLECFNTDVDGQTCVQTFQDWVQDLSNRHVGVTGVQEIQTPTP